MVMAAHAYPHGVAKDPEPRPLFAVGDQVRLASETKRMTVSEVKDGLVEAEWLDRNDEHHSWPFDPRMLVLVHSAP